MAQVATVPDGTLAVVVTKKDDPKLRILDCEIVMESDLFAIRDDAWWRGVRSGQLPVDRQGLAMRVIPGERIGPCYRGFAIELGDAERRYARRYSIYSLRDTAQRAIARLLQQKVLQAEDSVNYFLTALPEGKSGGASGEGKSAPPEPAAPPAALKVTPRSPSLTLEEASLSAYLRASEPLEKGWATPALSTEEPDKANEMTVLFSPMAWELGRQFARRGQDVESAAVWTGRLFRDLDSPEVFMLIEACIEAQHASEDRYSVTFSGATWGRVHEVLGKRRRRLNRPHEIILGSVHGHNFAPGTEEEGRKLCDACELQPSCSRTTAIASTLDTQWHKSVFAGQPYAVLGIWGYSARGDEVWQLYGLEEGTLVARGARILVGEPD